MNQDFDSSQGISTLETQTNISSTGTSRAKEAQNEIPSLTGQTVVLDVAVFMALAQNMGHSSSDQTALYPKTPTAGIK